MKNKNNQPINENNYSTILVEAEKDLKVVLKNYNYRISSNASIGELCISTLENNLLFIVLACIYAVLPYFWFESNNFTIILMIILYYTFLILFIINLSRRSRKIIIDMNKKEIRVENNNILGRFVFRKKVFALNKKSNFDVKLERVRGRGICEQILINEESVQFVLFEYKTKELTKERGNKVIEIIKKMM